MEEINYEKIKNLSKNDWKPIRELISIRVFSICYLNRDNPRFDFEISRDDSEDGVLVDRFSGCVHPAELVEVTDQKKENDNSKLIKKNGISEIYESFDTNKILETIRKKVDKKYSDEKERILIVNASKCIPFSWKDKWSAVFEYTKSTPFWAVYAMQYTMYPEILVLKES